MEDFQEQEYEFLRRLDEERFGRGDAAQARPCDRGGPHRHLVARGRPRGAGEGARGPAAPRDQEEPVRARRGGQEGRAPERDRAAARLGELRRDHLDLHEEVRHPDHERQPQRHLRRRRTRRSSRSRAIRAHRTSSTSARRSRSPAPSRACTPGTTSSNYETVPRAMKDTRGLWTGDYYGSVTIGYNANVVKTPPKTFADLLKPIYKNQVALNGSPLTVRLGDRGRVRGGARERRLALERRPRGRLVREGQGGRELHPGGDDAADGRVRPDADLDRLGLQQLRLREGVPVGELEGRHPRDGQYGALLLPGGQRDGAASRGPPGCGRSSSTPTRGRSST